MLQLRWLLRRNVGGGCCEIGGKVRVPWWKLPIIHYFSSDLQLNAWILSTLCNCTGKRISPKIICIRPLWSRSKARSRKVKCMFFDIFHRWTSPCSFRLNQLILEQFLDTKSALMLTILFQTPSNNSVRKATLHAEGVLPLKYWPTNL